MWLLARTTVAIPVSGPAVPLRKTLGAVSRTLMFKLLLIPPGERNTSVASPSASKGSWALICDGDTRNKGTGSPLTVRHAPPSRVGIGIALATAVTVLSWLPKTEIKPPDATGG